MKKIKSTAVIYDVVEAAMTGLVQPITVAELMEIPSVRTAAIEKFGADIQVSTNKLSDMLGFMWRRGVLERYPASSSITMARFAYMLKEAASTEPKAIPNAKPRPVSNRILCTDLVDGSVQIDFEHFSIVVKPRQK